MSDDEFLARWSRLKQGAAAQAKQDSKKPEEAIPPAPPTAPPAEPESAEADLSSLPPIDSIDAATDITAFLRKGIPQELSRAALRRAWSADPAIRDFVGLAENAWDFNDPTAMPGFGPLDESPEQVEALVRRIVGGVARTVEDLSDRLAPAAKIERSAPHGSVLAQVPGRVQPTTGTQSPALLSATEPRTGSAAPQSTAAEADPEEPSVRGRTHGGALPR